MFRGSIKKASIIECAAKREESLVSEIMRFSLKSPARMMLCSGDHITERLLRFTKKASLGVFCSCVCCKSSYCWL